MMSYVIVRSKEVKVLRDKLIELQLLQDDGKILKLNGDERGLPLCDSPHTQEAVNNECIVVDGSSYRIYKRLDQHETPKRPYEVMKCAVESVLTEKNLWREELVREIPKSWKKLGDMILFDSKSFVDPAWKQAGDFLWTVVCAALNAKRLGRMYRIQPDGFRSPRVEIFWGETSWVTIMDNGIEYSWDVKLCMFSSGNATERFRISYMDCKGETVVDLYAGIGYFTLPFLVHANADFVHACDWNRDALLALRYNLIQNKVDERCCMHLGDNSKVAPVNVADRVYMGLIPTCQQGILAACKALKFHSGGILHMHENVSSYRKKMSANQPSTSLESSHTPPKPVSEFPCEPPCEQCHTILLDFPKALMHQIEESFEDGGKVNSNGKFSMSFYLEGKDCDSEWCTTSQIVWKKKEWFLQALHSSHLVCSFLSNFHNCPWRVEFINLHHVKSYAPHIDHLVFDLKCSLVK